MNISNVQSGYSISHILTMSVTAVQGNWADFHRRALGRVSALPGVQYAAFAWGVPLTGNNWPATGQYAAFAWGVPLTGNNWPATVDIEGQPAATKESDRISVPVRSVTPDYF